jgi:hypothetical protein
LVAFFISIVPTGVTNRMLPRKILAAARALYIV